MFLDDMSDDVISIVHMEANLNDLPAMARVNRRWRSLANGCNMWLCGGDSELRRLRAKAAVLAARVTSVADAPPTFLRADPASMNERMMREQSLGQLQRRTAHQAEAILIVLRSVCLEFESKVSRFAARLRASAPLGTCCYEPPRVHYDRLD